MSSIKLSDFKSNIKSLARPNRFWVEISSPNVVFNNQTLGFFTKSVSLPGVTVGDIELHWFGKSYKIAGDPTYEDLTISFLNSSDFELRNLILKWIRIISANGDNERENHEDYKGNIEISQLGDNGEPLQIIHCEGVYPKSLDAIELSMESIDSIEEFSVNFAYDYWYNLNESSDFK